MSLITAAIMQPTYLPWLGYMALMDRVDVFVYLDSVQFDKRSWQQRNRIKTANGMQWLTVPVKSKGKREQRINEVELDAASGFARKHVTAMTLAYKKAPRATDLAEALFPVYERGQSRLLDLNVDTLESLRGLLGIDTPLKLSSEMAATGTKADLLAGLCSELGVERYVSPPGSRDYLEASDAFSRAGIEVAYHEYDHPEYPQLHGVFEPYLSVVDLLANVESGEALDLIRAGVGQPS